MAFDFVCDVHITPRLIQMLREQGHAADHAVAIGLDKASDAEIWRYAEDRDAIIVTKDIDFVSLNVSQPGPRVILVRLGNCTNVVFLTKFSESLPRILELFTAGIRLVELT